MHSLANVRATPRSGFRTINFRFHLLFHPQFHVLIEFSNY